MKPSLKYIYSKPFTLGNSCVLQYLMIYCPTADTVEPVYYGHLGTRKKCPDYQGVLIFQTFHTITKCVDYAGVRMCPD